MRKKIVFVLVLMLILVGCSENQSTESTENNSTEGTGQEVQVIKIATSSTTHNVMEKVAEVFNKDNSDYIVEVKMFDDAVTPNHALAEGSIDATLHQHTDYMNAFNEEHGTDLKRYGDPVFYNLAGWYSVKITSFDQLEDGMLVGIGNDPTNRAEALINLERAGIIELNPDAEIPTVLDIASNPLNLEFMEMERLGVASSLEDLDIGYSNADAVFKNDLDPSKALMYHEPIDGTSIVLVINEEAEWAELLYEVLSSEEVKDYIRNETNGTKAVYGEEVI